MVSSRFVGGIATDFATRCLVMIQHNAYDERAGKVLNVFSDPGRALSCSNAEPLVDVVYEAAKAMYAQRLQVSDETTRPGDKQPVFGE